MIRWDRPWVRLGEWAQVTIELEPRDLWVGIYWDVRPEPTLWVVHLYVCVVPLFPVHWVLSFEE